MNEIQLFNPENMNVSVVEILWYILGVLVIIFILHSIIATYHWFTYGTERSVPLLATIIYNTVGGLLLISMAILLLTI